MCGIVGIYGYKKEVVSFEPYLKKCLLTMKRRGPDSNGIWHNNQNYLAGFVRLAIRDISENGNQPMVSSCENYVLSFNGEIYNSNDFISALKEKAVTFKSHSDTEVLLYALIHFGVEKVLNEFDGMFAFSFYDLKKNTLILARDRVGIKPLYIGCHTDYLIYSSQYDHIINASFIKKNGINYSSLAQYLQYGYMIAGEAIINNTMVVPPGNYISIDTNGYTLTQYYNFHQTFSSEKPTDTEQIFCNSVQEQLVSDVPLGTFLSGGVDSPLINIWANEKKPVMAFTIGNENPLYDESWYAKEYAKVIGVNHHYKTITENDFLALLEDNFKAFSEPFADFSSIPTMLVARIAKELVTVILSGDGPDELFWGYDRNINFPLKNQRFHKPKLKLLFERITSENAISKKYFTAPNISSFYSQSLQLYGAEYWMSKVFKLAYKKEPALLNFPKEYNNSKDTETSMQMIRWLEMNIHLQRILLKVDRATMYYSLEARVPYLSNAVLDYASSLKYTDCIEGIQGKSNLKRLLKKRFPAEWVDKKKQGFMVPMSDWITKEIKDDLFHTILNMPDELGIAFRKNNLRKMLEAQVNKQTDANGFIWGIYALVKWHALHRFSKDLQ